MPVCSTCLPASLLGKAFRLHFHSHKTCWYFILRLQSLLGARSGLKRWEENVKSKPERRKKSQPMNATQEFPFLCSAFTRRMKIDFHRSSSVLLNGNFSFFVSNCRGGVRGRGACSVVGIDSTARIFHFHCCGQRALQAFRLRPGFSDDGRAWADFFYVFLQFSSSSVSLTSLKSVFRLIRRSSRRSRTDLLSGP